MSTPFDVSMGRSLTYVDLIIAAGSEELVIVPLESSGLEGDNVLRTCISVDSIMATNTESAIGRMTATTLTLSGTSVQLTTAIDWVAPSAGPEVGCLVFACDPTGSSPDTDLVPLWTLSVAFTPNGTDDFEIPALTDLFQVNAG